MPNVETPLFLLSLSLFFFPSLKASYFPSDFAEFRLFGQRPRREWEMRRRRARVERVTGSELRAPRQHQRGNYTSPLMTLNDLIV